MTWVITKNYLITLSLQTPTYKYFLIVHNFEIATLTTSVKCEHTIVVFPFLLQHVNHPVTTIIYNNSYCTERFPGYALYLKVFSKVALMQTFHSNYTRSI